MAVKLLKPARAGDQFKTLSVKIPLALSERIISIQERAKESGLILDLNRELSIALARIVKTGEVELSQVDNKKAGGNENGA